MSFVARLNSGPCRNAPQNSRLGNLTKLRKIKFLTDKKIVFIKSRTKIPTYHVAPTGCDVDKHLKGGGSGAPQSTTCGETHDAPKKQSVSISVAPPIMGLQKLVMGVTELVIGVMEPIMNVC